MSGMVSHLHYRILAVDDDSENLRLLTLQLSMAGYEHIATASSGRKVQEQFAAERPDLVVLDVMMSGMDGYQVTQWIRETYPDVFIPIILVSALQSPEDRVKGLRAGANDFLSRPYYSEELVARIEALATRKAARDQLSAQRDRLSLLYTITIALASRLDPQSLLAEIVVQTVNATHADQAFLVFLDDREHVFQKIQMQKGQTPAFVDKIDLTVQLEGLLGWVIEHREGILVSDLNSDSRLAPVPETQRETGSALGVPLVFGEHVVGALLLVSSRLGCFAQDQLDLLAAAAAQASIAFENALLFEETRRQRSRLEAILMQTADGVIVTNQRGDITRINPAACTLFDLDEGILGRPLDKVFHISIADLLVRAQERGEPVSGEFSIRDEQGEAQTVLSLSVSPVLDLGYVLVAQNITPLREVEQFRLAHERAEVQRILDTLSRYMSESVVERAIHDRTFLERRERREAVVLFADLRGFTRLTEKHPPDQVVDLLDEFFTAMIDIAHKHEGVILGFAGDEIMIGFNLPYDQSDANHRALLTAIEMQRRFTTLREAWTAQGMAVGMGVGMSRGMVVIGNVGGPTRMDYTTVGHTVNLAHRLVEKAQDGQIIVSTEVLAEGLPPVEGVNLHELPPLQVKGREEPLFAFMLDIG
jgi:PAS domain S-box-containing protein